MTDLTAALQRARGLLLRRLRDLEARLLHAGARGTAKGKRKRTGAGNETAWAAYTATAVALARLTRALEAAVPQRHLTTAELAERLGVRPKTVLRHMRRPGGVPGAEPVRLGRRIRWRTTGPGTRP